jgi:hypothetical protein
MKIEFKKLALCLCAVFAARLPCSDAADSTEGIAFFEKRIRPVLAKHCYKCHSAQAVKSNELASGLQLDTRAGIRQGGDTGAAVVPGKPAQSLILAAIKHEQDLKMPPEGDRLSPAVVADFSKWISMGAPDPRDGKPIEVGIDFKSAREFWSLRPVHMPAVPKVGDLTWPRNDVDRFVAKRRTDKKMQPVGDASRQVILRRLFFDLIGLPPTIDELRRFQDSPLEQVVDYLLDSAHFGERWGRHWLDVARFAESNGRARNYLGFEVSEVTSLISNPCSRRDAGVGCDRLARGFERLES